MSIEGKPGTDYYLLAYGWSMTDLVNEVNALQVKHKYQCVGGIGQQGGLYTQPMVNATLIAGTTKDST